MRSPAQLLDDKNLIEKYNSSGILDSIYLLSDQMRAAWEESYETVIPASCLLVKNIIISGMGGSGIPGRIIDSLASSVLRVPVETSSAYHLPSYIDLDSLVIAISYSGETVETLNAFAEARGRGAKIFVITSGGSLAKLGKQFDFPGYYFEPKFNPSGQPRTGIGYLVMGVMGLLNKCELIKFPNSAATAAIRFLRSQAGNFGPRISVRQNPAKLLALGLEGKIPVLVASEHLVGAAHSFKNMLNESAKTFATLFDLPELDHHLLEGLQFPHGNRNNLIFLFFESNIYHPEIKKRLRATKDVVKKNNLESLTFHTRSEKPFIEAMEIVQMGGFVSFYLACINHVDPGPVPWVNYFKDQIRQQKLIR